LNWTFDGQSHLIVFSVSTAVVGVEQWMVLFIVLPVRDCKMNVGC